MAQSDPRQEAKLGYTLRPEAGPDGQQAKHAGERLLWAVALERWWTNRLSKAKPLIFAWRSSGKASLAAAMGCDFNRSLQHLDSITRAGGVADGVQEEKIFHRGRARVHVESLAGRRLIA